VADYRDEKRRLYHRLIVRGGRKTEFQAIAQADSVAAPSELLAKWEQKFFQLPMDSYPTEPRLINRFCVGADPEFILEMPQIDAAGNRVRGRYRHAQTCGLDTLTAFGSDMSGRQAELRAYPSRFILDVIASLVDTVRWMNEAYGLDKIDWIAPAKYGDDGVGGHIHIGRKRPDTPVCIQSLDAVTQLLLAANVLDSKGQAARREATYYGRFGDWRPQVHGYEYRTMPSWMTSPWAAYFTLVVSKLCILNDATEFLSNDRPQETLINLLRAYKFRDDDARICLLALQKLGFPKYENSDFKKRWGVAPSTCTLNTIRTFFPPVIKPTEETKQQLFDYLVHGKALPAKLPNCNWKPFGLPEDVYKATAQPHVYGVSDVAQGLLSRGCMVHFSRGDRRRFTVTSQTPMDAKALTAAIRKHPVLDWVVHVAKCDKSSPPQMHISIPSDIYDQHAHATNKDQRAAIRSVLTESGLFPIFKYEDIDKPPVEPPKPVRKKPLPSRGSIVSMVRGEVQRDDNDSRYEEA
jgi:hypothetical protein